MKLVVLILTTYAVAFANPVPKFEGKIVGGVETTIENFPYQVSVRFNDRHICGGSIINVRNILTAAHCVYDKDHSQYSIRAGNSVHSEGEQYIVNRIVMNKDFDSNTVDNDLAILILKYPLSFNNRIQAIPLESPGYESLTGSLATVTGWGVQREGNTNIPLNLRKTSVAIISNLQCQKKYFSLANITSHMMCAQSIGHDSCQGDSGGPLAIDEKLIGVVSWGIGCANFNYPGVYAKVSDLHSWIVANLDNNSGTQFSIPLVNLLLAITIFVIL